MKEEVSRLVGEALPATQPEGEIGHLPVELPAVSVVTPPTVPLII